MIRWLLFSSVLLVIMAVAKDRHVNPILSEEFIDEINIKTGGEWVAGHNFDPKTSTSSIKDLMGVLDVERLGALTSGFLEEKVYEENELESLPRVFDARHYWPNCPSISDIFDQGCCGSCWAFGAVTAMSDRLCIHSNGKVKVKVSPENVLACCHTCGGCHGGYPLRAWIFWNEKGIVTGGKYGSYEGCQPYTIPPLFVQGHLPCNKLKKTPACHKYCENPYYHKNYNSDKTFGEKPYLIRGDQKQIMKELLTNGPVEATYSVYTDFVHYKLGVYNHTTGAYLGGHAVRLLGWGEENGKPYWLAANSWNWNWGEKGTFKILRGVNHCGIESYVVAGLPKFS